MEQTSAIYEGMLQSIAQLEVCYYKNSFRGGINDIHDIKKKISKDLVERFEPEFQLIQQSIRNLCNFHGDFNDKDQLFKIYKDHVKTIKKSIEIFLEFIKMIKGKRYEFEMAEIFRRLFKMSFHPPEDNNIYETLVYPVYNIFFDFFNMNSNIINFKSSTGSGKTRCAPFMFSILSYYEELKMPFFIMTQPGKTIIDDKVEDFTNFFGDTVILETDPKKYLEYYKQQNITKPIIGLFSPRSLLVLISKSFKKHIKIFDRTRFCLDEIHERDNYTDVVISRLAENCPPFKINKHIMMMSATPDDRIFKVFNRNGYKKGDLILTDKCLFPIKDISITVKDTNETVNEAVNNTITIIDNMANNKSLQGHILIFTSGRQRILDIHRQLIVELKEYKRKVQKVRLLLYAENVMSDEQSFMNYLKENASDSDKLYILPIPFISYVPPYQKKIAKGNIPNYNNIIKVVIATNAIESSITIDKMAAVIDCGVMNIPDTNSSIGVTNLKESPITRQNQLQRRGRVGRVMPGTAVQITLEGKKIPEYQDPEILKSDISSFVLDLRRIGIRFETLYKLPDKVPKEKVNSIINMLKNIGALNQATGNLTNDGFILSSFRNFSPFISASILNLSRNYYDGEVTPMLLAALSLKLISDDIILNNLCPKFVQNFNYESDLDTIMKTFIEMVLKRRKITEIAPDFGFHPKKATQIVGEIFDLSETLDIGDTEDLWTNIDEFYQNCDFVHTFCQRLFDEIEKNSENGAWITARKAQLDMISNTKFEPEFRFKADECHSFEETEKLDESNKFAEYIPSYDKEKQESYIITKSRPGSYSFNVPSNVLILNIQRNANLKMNYGTIIHIDQRAEQKYKPFSININSSFDTPFFIPMMNGFVSYYYKLMLKFNLIGKASKCKNGSSFFGFSSLNNNKEICMNAFPATKKYDEIVSKINEGIKLVRDLAPFTPQTILIKHPTMEYCCSLKGYGIDKIDYDVISFNEPSFNAYHVNEASIKYIHSKIEELSKHSSICTIAITGEDMSFSDDKDDIVDEDQKKEKKKKKFVSFPHTFAKCDSVFSKPKDYSHLVIISKKIIPKAERITWKVNKPPEKCTPDPNSTKQWEDIFPNAVCVNKTPWVLFYPQRYAIEYRSTKDIPNIPNRRNQIIKLSEFAPIIEEFSKKCVDGQNLINDVNLEITITGTFDYDKVIELKSSLVKANQMPTIHQLNELKIMLEEDPDLYTEIARYHNIDVRLLEIRNVNKLLALDKITQFNQIQSIQFIKNCATFEIHSTDDLSSEFFKFMKTFKVSRHEILSTYEVQIKNLNSFNLQKDEFMKKVQSVLEHFNGVIFKVSKYNRDFENVTVTVPKEFFEPLIAMLRNKISNKFILKIPEEIVPSYLLNYREVLNSLSKYFESKKINLINDDYDFCGFLEDVERAEKVLFEDPPKLPVYSVKIPPDCNIKSLEIAIKVQNSFYQLDKRFNFLIVPIEEDQETVNTFIDRFGTRGIFVGKRGVPECFGDDVLMHNDPTLHSSESVNIYFPEKYIVSRPICLRCAKESIAYNLGKIIDLKGNINIPRALTNVDHIGIYSFYDFRNKYDQSQGIWPITPLGHLIWILLSSPISKRETKAYITALASLAFHKCPIFTYCPNHPEKLIFKQKFTEMHCLKKTCNMILCVHCGQWHPEGKCEGNNIPLGCRQCPFCDTIVKKIKLCNHISCSCGKHFCYYCGKGFDEGGDVDRHMDSAKHNDDPPDYQKFVQHKSVSDETLGKFYNEFPDIRKFIKH